MGDTLHTSVKATPGVAHDSRAVLRFKYFFEALIEPLTGTTRGYWKPGLLLGKASSYEEEGLFTDAEQFLPV